MVSPFSVWRNHPILTAIRAILIRVGLPSPMNVNDSPMANKHWLVRLCSMNRRVLPKIGWFTLKKKCLLSNHPAWVIVLDYIYTKILGIFNGYGSTPWSRGPNPGPLYSHQNDWTSWTFILPRRWSHGYWPILKYRVAPNTSDKRGVEVVDNGLKWHVFSHKKVTIIYLG